MNKFTIKQGNVKHSFGIDKYKIIIYENKNKLFKLKQGLINLVRQTENSEFSIENHNELEFKIDDKVINRKKTLFYLMNEDFFLSDELKMSVKSLLYKYFELQLNKKIYLDTINTIQILFDSLEALINENTEYKVSFQKITIKALLKMVTPYIIKDEMLCNEIDLSYDEIIQFQLCLLKEIEKDISFEHIIVVSEFPWITSDLLNCFEQFNKVKFIIMVQDYPTNIPYKNFYYIGKNDYDFADVENLYLELCERNACIYELREVEIMLQKYVNCEGINTDLSILLE